MNFKIGDTVRRIGTNLVFEIEAIEEPNPLTKALAVATGHPEVADDPLVMNHTNQLAFPAGLVELVTNHEVH